jgi:predicted pyridoxine 5'-phosphate oxidase superfamily flavin-nucleotide-binding protein
MTTVLDENTRKLIVSKNFATIATVNRDGSPRTSVVLMMRDGDDLMISTTATRLKAGTSRGIPE